VILPIVLGFGKTNAFANSENELFAEIVYTADLYARQRQKSQDPAIIRIRYANINFDLLGEDSVTLNLFYDVSFAAGKNRITKRADDNYTWVGGLEGVDHGQAVLVVQDGDLAGNITLSGGSYQVRPLGGGVHAIYEINQNAYPEEAPPIPVELPGKSLSAPPVSALDDGSTIDVLVVYTQDAANASANIGAEIQLAIDETNTSYANSNVIQRLRLVHSAQVSYTETGALGTDLGRLQGPSDGFMDNVHTLRNTYGADLVSLWVENGGNYCGIAYIMTTVSSFFENYAFSVVVDRGCATGYYSFGHEFGHNMGARHDWYVDPTNNSPFTYNHGYVDPGNLWRTVMAYRNDCGSCPRVQYWSNPNVTYSGVPMGVPEGQFHAADNHKTLDNTAYTIANFRSSVVGDVVVEISTDQSFYITAETMDVTLGITDGGSSIMADLYIRIRFPNGTYRYYLYPGFSAVPTPVLSSWTVNDWGPSVIFSHTFSGGEAGGGYTWQAAFTNPGTTNVIGSMSSASFTFSP